MEDNLFESFLESIELAGKREEISTESIMKKVDSVLSTILTSKFHNPRKHGVQYLAQRINFACPYCLDSKTDADAKRGNLYTSNLFFVCYNCGVKKGFKPMLEDFFLEDEFSFSELEFIKTLSIDGSSKSFSSKRVSEVYNQIVSLQQHGINRNVVMKLYGFDEVTSHKSIVDYLKGRDQLNIDVRLFAYDKKTNAIVMFNMSADYSMVYSFQRRFLSAKGKDLRFLTKKYSEIALDMGVTISDEILRNRLDKISYFYNIFRIRFSDHIFIFEGTMDANHWFNTLATWSASNTIVLPSGYYLFDNSMIDDAGKKAAINMLNKGIKVFLWGKFLEDFPEFKLCKDLDDIWKKKKIYPKDLMGYFSSHPLDLIYI